MSDVDEVRRALSAAQEASAAATDARVRAAAAVRHAEAARAAALRTGDRRALRVAEHDLEEARGAASAAGEARLQAREALAAGLGRAAEVVDPRLLVQGMDPRFPVLLFPVRLETRFMTVAGGVGLGTHLSDLAHVTHSSTPRHQLCVRIFPDTCSVDAFGEELTDTEVRDVRAYWTEVWHAAGDEAGERAAWRALVASHGSGRSAWLVATHRPDNPADQPASPEDPQADPVFTDVDTTPGGWNRAPRARGLPDRFVLVTESGGQHAEHLGRPVPPEVFTGPDPLAPPEDQIRPVDGRLEVPDELAWLVDFDRAVADGLGFRVDLNTDQAQGGFDRVYALGVRVLADAEESATELETLVSHHRFSRAGFSLVPQGAPTNNTEDTPSAHSTLDDPDASFDALRAGPVPLEADPRRRLDGQWFADLLGIDPTVLDGVPHAHGADQRDARAMQSLLWPATMGYLLGTALEPVIDDDTVEHARWFFSRHVRGRGSLPAFRVGRQPYGILATTAFSRSAWLRGPQPDLSGRPGFLVGLQRLLALADAEWDGFVGQVPSLGRGAAPVTDPRATLLGILGLHPSAAEFGYRYAEGIEQLVNKAGLAGWYEDLYQTFLQANLDAPARALLAQMGYDGDERAPLLDLYFHGRYAPLKGPLVDDRPLSESEAVRVWATGDRNYLQWLRDAATTSLDTLRTTTGFLEGAPTTLLFLLARHALTLGYAESARTLYHLAGYEATAVRAMRREPPFVHVDPDGPSESRFAPLYVHDPVISPGRDWTVAAHITDVLRVSPGTRVLRDQVDALELLADASTARLERAFTEHVDTVTHRLDAWQLGMVDLQLELMRGIPQDDVDEQVTAVPGPRGVYLGAYGWLEDVRPRRRPTTTPELPEDLAAVFASGPPLQQDPANGGHLLAPSLNQAVTASVLRNGYLTSASPGDPGAMAVNLPSERVRAALDVLTGMRQGQSLAELLGYIFERSLHDSSGLAEADEFISDLRGAFPLRAGHLQSTAPPEGTSVEAIEARNVVDGLALVKHVEQTGATTYPFGLPSAVLDPSASTAQRTALERAVVALQNLRDAVGDLALAEAVHQAVQGSADRAGAALRSVESGHQPPEPEVVRTPATGSTLTLRVGVHLDPAATASAGATPRALAEPAVDAWLASLLPPPAGVGCQVDWTDPVTGAARTATVTLADLGLSARDVVEVLRGGDQAMTELDDRVALHVLTTAAPRPDAVLRIAYREPGTAAVPMFEVVSLARHLRGVLAAARPLRLTDVIPSGEAAPEHDATAVADRSRLVDVKNVLDPLTADALAYLDKWEPLLDDPETHRAALLAGTDDAVDDAVGLLARGAGLAVGGSGWGQAIASRSAQYARTVARVRERVAAWQVRLDVVDAALLAYDTAGAPSDEERLAELARIEGVLVPALSDPADTPVAQRTAVGSLRAAFAARLAGLEAVSEGPSAGLADLRAALLAHLPLTDWDGEPFEVATTETAMLTLVEDVVATVRTLSAELERRSAAAQDALDAHTAAADASARLEALQTCAEALLGEGFLLVPTFTVPVPAATEWAQALAGVPTLLGHLHGAGRAEPVEDWVHSAARVRPAVRDLEQAGLVARAHGLTEPELVPVQLPYTDGPWLAMEFPPDTDVAGEHLLYTAVYPAEFDPMAPVCGLLVDEWTEVLPVDSATAGLAFHYDQPSSEAPQSLLLVTPASGGRTWTWEDVRQAVPDTMRLARQRAVEPVHVGQGPAARFLPATISAITTRGISMSLLYALNNDVHLATTGDEE